MAACRTVNVNMLWQQILNQPLVTASWNDLKTCVTFWPNLGWYSTRTEARTALMTSDFHYKPAVAPNVHSGWDRGCDGSAAPLGQECACSQGIRWAVVFSGLLFALALKSSGHFSFSPRLLSTSHLGAVLASICHGFPLLPSSPLGPEQCDTEQLPGNRPEALHKPCTTTVCRVCWSRCAADSKCLLNPVFWHRSLCSLMSHPCGLEQAGLS